MDLHRLILNGSLSKLVLSTEVEMHTCILNEKTTFDQRV